MTTEHSIIIHKPLANILISNTCISFKKIYYGTWKFIIICNIIKDVGNQNTGTYIQVNKSMQNLRNYFKYSLMWYKENIWLSNVE